MQVLTGQMQEDSEVSPALPGFSTHRIEGANQIMEAVNLASEAPC